MDANQISSNDVAGFKANLSLSPQVTDVIYVNKVMSDLNAPKDGKLFNADDVGESDPQDIVTIVPDSPEGLVDQTRRVGAYSGFHDGKFVKDQGAVANQLVDPSGEVIQAMRAGKHRKMDSAIRTGFFASAREGETGETTVAFPSAQVISAASRKFLHAAETTALPGSGSLPLTIGKLILARSMLAKSNIVGGKRYIAVDSDDISGLLSTIPATSGDYATLKRLESGELDQFMGFTFVRDENLGSKSGDSTIRELPVWLDKAMIYKAREIVTATITIRGDKSMRPYAYYEMQHGVMRRYDKGVIKMEVLKPT